MTAAQDSRVKHENDGYDFFIGENYDIQFG